MRIAVFCTCAENDCEKYLSNIRFWHRQFLRSSYFSNIDFHVFNDGKLTESTDDLSLSGLIFHELDPKLGRSENWGHEGWRRSFGEAVSTLADNYDFLAHVENDVKILNFESFDNNICKKGLFTGFFPTRLLPYSKWWVSSEYMILNNKEYCRTIGQYFLTHVYEKSCPELWLRLNNPFQNVFKICRLEKSQQFEEIANGLDAVSQINWKKEN